LIRIAIVEDNRLVRDGLIAMLAAEGDMVVTYAAASGDMVLLKEAGPRVILLDVGLEDHDSLTLAERVATELQDARVVVMDLLPAHDQLVEFVNVGVAGFVLKDATSEDLLGTIRSVAGGRKVLPPEMTSPLFSRIAEEAVLRGRHALTAATDLTDREQEVVELIGRGLSNKAIAAELQVSPHTVKSHVRNVMDKLALHTRLQIAAFMHGGDGSPDGDE
jgi:DNA-binding NarL/FixJ family response regulator